MIPIPLHALACKEHTHHKCTKLIVNFSV